MPATRALFAAGDVGGARALVPVAVELQIRGVPVALLAHGALDAEAPTTLPRVASEEAAWVGGHVGALLFATSVRDPRALALARDARRRGVPVLCLLDSWMNYRARLEVDGLPALVPDVYAVMDEDARAAACEDGLPAECIAVTGQPALGALATARSDRRRAESTDARRLLLFVSEPVASDQGADSSSATFRGYTERGVLASLCRRLQPHREAIRLGVLPHPREDHAALQASWEAARGGLDGSILAGREAIHEADAVAGMASILLYEARLLGKPVVSLQPGLRSSQLQNFMRAKGIPCVVDEDGWDPAVRMLLGSEQHPAVAERAAAELAFHVRAAARVADLVVQRMASTDSEDEQP